MKHSLLLLAVAALAASSASAADYATPGTGKSYSFGDIAALNAAVRQAGTNVWAVDSSFTVSAGDTLTLANGDTVRMADKVRITVDGATIFQPAVQAFITRTDDAAAPYGFKFMGDDSECVWNNVQCDYVAINYGGKVKPLMMTNCDFSLTLQKASSSGTIAFNGSGTGHSVIRGCTFSDTESAALSSGANIEVAVTIDSCRFERCNTKNSNRPAINMTTPGTAGTTYITNNVVIGDSTLTKVGGIAVNNMMSLPVGQAVIRGNDVRNCRYGLTALGQINVDIIDNTLVDNRYETNPMNGGSGISLSCPSTTLRLNSVIRGNHIEGSLWGITLIGAGTFSNIGHLEPADTADYNPGDNTFVRNGNDGEKYAPDTHPYDLYNNTPNECWAQGNVWSVPEQTEALIETVIFHQADQSDLGKVIFWPAGDASVTDIEADSDAPVTYYDLQGRPVAQPVPGQLLIRRQGSRATKTLTL